MTNQLEFSEQESFRIANSKAFVSLFVGLALLSSVAIFIRLSEQEIGPAATIFNRAWIASVFFLLWNGLKALRRRFSENKPVQQESYISGMVWQFLALGILLFIELFLWAWSLTQTSVANSSVLSHLTPLFTVLVGWLVWRMNFDSRFLIGMVIAVAASLAIGLEDLQISAGNALGDVAAVISAITFGGYLLVVEQLRTKLSPWTILTWGSLLVSLFSLSVALITEERLFPYSWGGWLSVIALALFGQVLGQGLLVYSLSRLSSGFVAVTFLLNPVITTIAAAVLFSERISFVNWVDFAVVLLGLYLAVTSKSTVKEL